MESIISRGKNIREAIEVGLELLEVSKNEVDIEIIQMEDKGFMGIGKKKAIVKLTHIEKGGNNTHNNNNSIEHMVNNIKDEPSKNNNLLNLNESHETKKSFLEKDLGGKAWVSNGKLHVKDSASEYATVNIGNDIQLFKNSELVTKSTTVITEKDSLEIKFKGETERETSWLVNTDAEKLKVILDIEPGYIVHYKLSDTSPERHIKLEAERTKTIMNTLTYDDVVKKLEKHRIIYGINHREIMSAIETSAPGSYEIAKGKSADPGKDGWLELKIDVDLKSGLVEDENGKIDFRETNFIPAVDRGKIIGVVHPPIPGKPGITVTNEPLPAKQTYPLKLILKGIVEVEDNLVAVEYGRPIIEQRGQLVKANIVPKLIQRDNVNLLSGNIRFIGDVEIFGDVEEGMAVEAGGDIFVHKSIIRANVVTSKSIMIKENVINSELTAGKNNILIAELGQLLDNMQIQLGKMIDLTRQLQKEPAFKSSEFEIRGLYPLISFFLESRFKNFVSQANKYRDLLKNGRKYLEDEDWYDVGITIKKIFFTLSKQIITIDNLLDLSQKMKELIEFSNTPVEANSFITIADTVNSNLYCSGDINIIGKGSVNTKIHAGGKVRVQGILRGGEVYGKLGVTINELGSNSGTKTIVTVPHDQYIEVNKACEGAVLKIGNVSYQLENEKYNFVARKNSDNIIIFE